MPAHVTSFRCLLISPGDVSEERDAIESAVAAWNGQVGVGLETRVEIVRWESHTRPEMGAPPQAIINQQLVDSCDFGIAVFWSRLGSPTANHPSGSAEEIERLLGKGANVMVYFSEKAIPQQRLRDDQFVRLQALRKDFESRGLLATFSSTEKLREMAVLHVTNLVSGLLTKLRASNQPIPSTGTLTAPMPDVRVTVGNWIGHDGAAAFSIVRIDVANHSPVDVYFSGVSLALANGKQLAIMRDAISGAPVLPQKLPSGDSLAVYFAPDTKEIDALEPADFVGAYAVDKIGRKYFAPDDEVSRAVRKYRESVAAFGKHQSTD